MPIQNVGPTTLPDLTGFRDQDAFDALTVLLLGLILGPPDYSEAGLPSFVKSQTPGAGDVPSGSAVRLVVSGQFYNAHHVRATRVARI